MKKLSWIWCKQTRHPDDLVWPGPARPPMTPNGSKGAFAAWRRPQQHDHVPPDDRLRILVDSVKDYQLTHGSLIKLVHLEQANTVPARPIGATLYPTRFPRSAFYEAEALQVAYNELYAAIAADEHWLKHALRPLLTKGSLAGKLWSIHADVAREGFVQDKSLGLFRSDYMLQAQYNDVPAKTPRCVPKQVEFNTYSCAGAAHATHVAAMHRHLFESGAYRGLDDQVRSDRLPKRDGVAGSVRAFAVADEEYRRQRKLAAGPGAEPLGRTAVLMVVQPFNVNIADERPLEYALWENGLPAFHVVWGQELLDHTFLTSSRELIFQPPGRPLEQFEVSVVYHRAGYDEAEYDLEGIQCRLRLERSRAIKCPSILGHLAGFKKVQQVLTETGQVERFVSAVDARRIRRSFMRLYPLDESPAGLRGRELACTPDAAMYHVLKPSLEGGGHNVFRDDIPEFLSHISPTSWRHFVLMELIDSPPAANVLIGPAGLYVGAVETELGIIGACLWKNHNHGSSPPQPAVELNECVGTTFKSKARGIDEMSVIKGYGCFDSPLLVD